MPIVLSHHEHSNVPMEPCIVCGRPTIWRITIPVIIAHVVKPVCEGCRDDAQHTLKLLGNAAGTLKINTRKIGE